MENTVCVKQKAPSNRVSELQDSIDRAFIELNTLDEAINGLSTQLRPITIEPILGAPDVKVTLPEYSTERGKNIGELTRIIINIRMHIEEIIATIEP